MEYKIGDKFRSKPDYAVNIELEIIYVPKTKFYDSQDYFVICNYSNRVAYQYAYNVYSEKFIDDNFTQITKQKTDSKDSTDWWQDYINYKNS